jgi:PPE-repeat protein
LEDENNKLCQFTIADLINLMYINPKYAANYMGNGVTEVVLINQTYRTKSNNTLWFQMVMHQDNGVITLAVNYKMNDNPWHYYTFGQFNRPSDVDLS